jgi:PAS domain S-box-containing protein
LCLPLVKQARLIGVLYLENDLSTDVFTPARNSVLKLLASEAAISLENSRLYDDLRRREARMRRMVDSNIIGIFTAAVDGYISEANEAFLRIIGYDRDDLEAGRLRWTELTPADWRWADDRALEEIAARGLASPYEKQYVKKDGTRVSVWFACSMFEDQPNDGVALVVDLTDRKRAEQAARESEQRYLQIQMDLAHANRVSTVGQLSASIAHEVNQPLSGILTNLSTCLRMLSNDPPNVEGARETVRRGIRDTSRAADVIQRLRALFSKTDTRREPLDMNAAIREVTALSQSELRSHRIELDLQLSGSLPLMEGDRIQMQQVMLNLVKNAVDAMSTATGHKRLVIRSETSGEDVVIAVADSGQGVGPADLARVFDAFYSTKSGGLGVGLSICRGIIEAHGGKISVTNAPHGGAVFEFTLPAQRPEPARHGLHGLAERALRLDHEPGQ